MHQPHISQCNWNVHASMHLSVTKWCIVGYLSDAFWDLWDGTIVITTKHWESPSSYGLHSPCNIVMTLIVSVAFTRPVLYHYESHSSCVHSFCGLHSNCNVSFVKFVYIYYKDSLIPLSMLIVCVPMDSISPAISTATSVYLSGSGWWRRGEVVW